MEDHHVQFQNHYDNIWNIFDTVINFCVVCYLFLIWATQNHYDTFRINRQAELNQLWTYEITTEVANILVSISLVITWIRLLYFLLPIPIVGPLVIAALRMNRDVIYFVILLAVFIFGFAAVFDLIFAGYWDMYTGYWTATFSTARLSIGNIGYYDSSVLVPLPSRWFGNGLIIIYALLAGILAVNFLIAMMGTTFSELWETTEKKWHQLDGELLLHYERFVFMPPPLNLFQNMVFVIYKLMACLIKSDSIITHDEDKKWRLFTKWHFPSENTEWNSKLLVFWYKNIKKRREEKKEGDKSILEVYLGDLDVDGIKLAIEKVENELPKDERNGKE